MTTLDGNNRISIGLACVLAVVIFWSGFAFSEVKDSQKAIKTLRADHQESMRAAKVDQSRVNKEQWGRLNEMKSIATDVAVVKSQVEAIYKMLERRQP